MSVIRISLNLSLLDPSPGDDGDPTLLAVLLRRTLKDAVTPQDVDVLSESVDGPVGLGHRNLSLGLRVLESRLALHAEGNGGREVLRARFIGLQGE